jgi:TnpA family transposase
MFLRYPGRVWQVDDAIPDYLLSYIQQQLNIEPSVLQDYSPSTTQRHRQFHILRQDFGFHTFNNNMKSILRSWLTPWALSTNKALALMDGLIEKMRREQIIIPAISTLEQFLYPIMQQADSNNFHRLTSDLTDKQKQHLNLLLANQGGTQLSYRTWLQQPPGLPTVDNLLTLLDRLAFIRRIDLNLPTDQPVNPNRLRQLARDVERLTTWRLRRIKNKTQIYAMLVAFVLQETSVLIDQTLEMFLLLYHQIFNRAKNNQTKQFYKDGKTINQHLRQYLDVGKALIAARRRQADPFQAIEKIMPWETFVTNMEQIETLVRPVTFDFLELVGNRYSYVRRFSPTLLQAFDFQGTEDSAGLRQGIQLIRDIDQNKRSELPDWTPTDFVNKRWKSYVFDKSGIQRRYYELCALSQLREQLRSGDIWVNGSQNFQNLADYLIPDDQWQTMREANAIPVSVPLNCVTYLRSRHEALHEQLQIVDEGLAKGDFPGVELLDDRLKMSRTKLDVPSNMKQITRAVYNLLPRIRITDLLLEVDATVNFSSHFTHLQSDEPIDDPVLLCTALLARAINLGVEKMAIASRHTTYDKLAWMADWFIRDETYSKASSDLVHFQLSNPFAHHWGSGMTSSSDSQYFPVGGTRSLAAHRNPYYGSEPGIAFYTHVSDQNSPFYVQVIATRVRKAPYMLNGLLNHDTQLDIREHSTDTTGFTDHIFALCHLLGFRFAPRIRRFHENRLYTINPKKMYPTLNPLIAARINTDVVHECWDDTLRIASSLRLGTVTAPVFVQRLSAYPKQNRWAKALREIGRLERVLLQKVS